MSIACKIALCDPDREDAQSCRKLLEQFFYRDAILPRIDVFESGEDFLAAAASEYDLVVLENRLLGLDGMETLHRARQRCPDLPAVFCTGDITRAVHGYDLPAQGYLIKPVEEDLLFETLDRFLKGKS